MQIPRLIPKLSLILANLLHNHFNPSTQNTQTSPTFTTPAIPSTTTTAPSTTTQSPAPTLAARAGGFTNSLLPTHPTIFYVTATAYSVVSGSTIYTTYTQLVSGTTAIPWTASTQMDLSALATATSTSSSTVDTSLVFPVQPSIPPGSPTPTLDLGVCSTATGNGVKACGDIVIKSFNSKFAGETTSSTGGSEDGGGEGSVSSVVPTRTVTATYLGAEVAKGKATWGVGAKANGGLRLFGNAGWRVIQALVVVSVGRVVVKVFEQL